MILITCGGIRDVVGLLSSSNPDIAAAAISGILLREYTLPT